MTPPARPHPKWYNFGVCNNATLYKRAVQKLLIHIFPFIHNKWAVFAYMCGHGHRAAVLPILTLALFSSSVIDNAQCR